MGLTGKGRVLLLQFLRAFPASNSQGGGLKWALETDETGEALLLDGYVGNYELAPGLILTVTREDAKLLSELAASFQKCRYLRRATGSFSGKLSMFR